MLIRLAHIQIEEGSRIVAGMAPELAIHEGDLCVTQIERVLEFGRVIQLEQIEDETVAQKSHASILRCATLQDQAKAKENAVMSKMARDRVMSKAALHHLQIKLIRVRYSFDRSVLMVLFVSEEHAEYKDLIRDLSVELNARIDIRQIGVRDEAALLGGIGSCGRQLCCCTWLRHFESINVKMAKAQGISLNPGAISGMCGRLRCCLGYEYENYRQLERQLPREGACVECSAGKGRVCGRDILRQRVKIRLEDERLVECEPDELRRTWTNPHDGREESPNEDTHSERT